MIIKFLISQFAVTLKQQNQHRNLWYTLDVKIWLNGYTVLQNILNAINYFLGTNVSGIEI